MPAATPAGRVAIRMAGVGVWAVRDGDSRVPILDGVHWQVEAGQHWAVLGPNGAGKSTLLRLAGAVRHPSRGRVELLGELVGRTDLRAMRARIGMVDAATALTLPAWLAAGDVVLTGATGTVQPRWDRYGPAERRRAGQLLDLVGCAHLAGRPLGRCSTGEQQRVQVARALMAESELLLLDEPAAGLDLPAREALLAVMTELAAARPELTTVTVTHHLEELPASVTHALLLRAGSPVVAAPVAGALTAEHLSACFGLPVEVGKVGGRWMAWSPARWR
jgi:iron complex transport system ATP-binding protein